MSDPIKLFTVILLVALPTVMFGGFSLLRLIPKQRLSAFQLTWFRAGHAHAGVLLLLALVAVDVLARTSAGAGLRWTTGALLVIGVLAQSGGMFLHMAIGRPDRWSLGNTLTALGAMSLAAGIALDALAVVQT